MKLTFECKLTMSEYISDEEVKRVLTKEEIARNLAATIREALNETGGVSIDDATLTKEGGDNEKAD